MYHQDPTRSVLLFFFPAPGGFFPCAEGIQGRPLPLFHFRNLDEKTWASPVRKGPWPIFHGHLKGFFLISRLSVGWVEWGSLFSGKELNVRGLNHLTIWLFNIAMENGPFIDDFPIKTSIYKGFSMAMFNNQRVNLHIVLAEVTFGEGSQGHIKLSLVVILLPDLTLDILDQTPGNGVNAH